VADEFVLGHGKPFIQTDRQLAFRVGKKKAGCLLEGKQIQETPEIRGIT